MFSRMAVRRSGWLMLAVFVMGTGACSSDEGPDDEPAIAQIRLVIGAQTFTSVGNNPPATATVIPVGAHNVVMTALLANGQTIALNASDFELRITSSNAAVINYAKSTAFTGVLTAAAAGNANLDVQVFHLGEGHADFRIQAWAVTVQ